ncbi:uncharacterized protein LOC142975740 [Anticarsia gemmatalis]|uniref:uncharacterized protein LOC142975740 n=1 Tax=Anticarsia gemmatalis TaxID=129554 RepID=UPI003F761C6F
MSDIMAIYDGESPENSARVSRPTLAQVRAVISFMEKHPDLAHRKLRVGMGHAKFKKLWLELSNIVNSMDGAMKSTKGWIKFWSDKRRSIIIKKKQIQQGKIQGSLTALEEKILDLCNDNDSSSTRKKKTVKSEPCNGDDNDSFDEVLSNDYSHMDNSRHDSLMDEQHFNLIDKMLVVMDQQSVALAQMAQANLTSSKAMERIAEASHIQAVAIDRLAGTFDRINTSFHDVRNAIIGIDYTMKRCYPPVPIQRQNPNIFS